MEKTINKCKDCGTKIRGKNYCQKCYLDKHNPMDKIENRKNYTLKYNISRNFLVQEYSKNKKSREKIANEVGCSSTFIRDKLIEYSISIRTIGESHKGKKHPHSKETRKKISLGHGGTGIPYENTEYGTKFDSALKEQVRFRDGYKCQICGCTQLENGRQLDCHHIDYDKKHNELNNLIALCMKCHTKTNINRDYWMNYFERKLLCRKQ